MIERSAQGKPNAPTANSAVVVFDSNNDNSFGSRKVARLRLKAFLDVTFAINQYWAKDKQAATPLRLEKSTWCSAGPYVTAVHAALPITVVAKANLLNNDNFTVVRTQTKGGVATAKTVVFEYKVDGTFVATNGRTTIDVSAATTATTVAVATAAAIATAFAEFSVPVPSSATLTMTNLQSGAMFVISATEAVADAGFTIGSATAGVEGTIVNYDCPLPPEGSRLQLEIAVTAAPTEFDIALELVDDMVLGTSSP